MKRVEEVLLRKNEDPNAAHQELTPAGEELRQDSGKPGKNEELIRASEDKFRALVELSLDGLFIMDFTGKLLFVNRAAGNIIDVADCEAVTGRRNVMEFVDKASQAAVLRDMSLVARGIFTNIVYYKLITEKKREIWVECIGRKIQYGDSSAILVSMRDVTERKLAEERVRESENKFSTVFRSSPVALTLVSAIDGKFVDINDTFTGNTGYSRDDVIGKTAEELGIFADRNEYEQMRSLLRDGHRVDGMELKCRIKTGGIRTCRFSSGVILMGSKPHILSSVEDVTEQRKAQEAFRESELLLREVFDNANDAIFLIETAPDQGPGKYILVNRKAVQMLGYSQKELLAMSPRDIVPDDIAKKVVPGIRENLIRDRQATFESAYRRKDGSIFPIEVSVHMFPYKGKDVSLSIVRDITERKRAEELLRESEEKFRGMAERSSDLIFILDKGMSPIYVSPSSRSILGYDPEELVGKTPEFAAEKVIFSQKRPEFMNTIHEHMNGLPFENLETQLRKKDGTPVYVNVQAIPIMHEGAFAGAQISLREITERKRAEEALRQANKKLNLLSGITRHDIRNQLLVLNGFVALLRKEIPDPSHNDYFSRITAASHQITNMIQFTKEYEKVGVLAPAWQDIRTLVDNAGRDAALGQVTLKNNLPANTEIFADPLIARVFFNLVDNAVRHGGKITTVCFSLEERDGNRIIVCADDGDGIAREEKERIFDLGFGKNTGFGLAISREILDITGITIKETGEPGKGVRFEIAVPKSQYRSAS